MLRAGGGGGGGKEADGGGPGEKGRDDPQRLRAGLRLRVADSAPHRQPLKGAVGDGPYPMRSGQGITVSESTARSLVRWRTRPELRGAGGGARLHLHA